GVQTCALPISRVAPAGTDLGMHTVYRWWAEAGGLGLEVSMEPEGPWTFPVPRMGVHLELPARVERVEWFGRGPGEAYRDVGRAARVGRFDRKIDAPQTRPRGPGPPAPGSGPPRHRHRRVRAGRAAPAHLARRTPHLQAAVVPGGVTFTGRYGRGPVGTHPPDGVRCGRPSPGPAVPM